jgi:hypothetical protein
MSELSHTAYCHSHLETTGALCHSSSWDVCRLTYPKSLDLAIAQRLENR